MVDNYRHGTIVAFGLLGVLASGLACIGLTEKLNQTFGKDGAMIMTVGICLLAGALTAFIASYFINRTQLNRMMQFKQLEELISSNKRQLPDIVTRS